MLSASSVTDRIIGSSKFDIRGGQDVRSAARPLLSDHHGSCARNRGALQLRASSGEMGK